MRPKSSRRILHPATGCGRSWTAQARQERDGPPLRRDSELERGVLGFDLALGAPTGHNGEVRCKSGALPPPSLTACRLDVAARPTSGEGDTTGESARDDSSLPSQETYPRVLAVDFLRRQRVCTGRSVPRRVQAH